MEVFIFLNLSENQQLIIKVNYIWAYLSVVFTEEADYTLFSIFSKSHMSVVRLHKTYFSYEHLRYLKAHLENYFEKLVVS